MNSPIFHFVDPVCNSYLFTEPGIYTLPELQKKYSQEDNVNQKIVDKSIYDILVNNSY